MNISTFSGTIGSYLPIILDGLVFDLYASSYFGILLLINPDFLDEGEDYIAFIYSDGEKADWKDNPLDIDYYEETVNFNTQLKIRLAPGGGQAIRFAKKR